MKLLRFDAAIERNEVVLKWCTSEALEISHYEIERSTDGLSFTKTGLLFHYEQGSVQEYIYTEQVNDISEKKVFYRLRIVDANGHAEYSPVRSIKKEEKKQLTLHTYPIGAVSQVKVSLPIQWHGKEVHFEMINIYGQVHKPQEVKAAKNIEIVDVSHLQRGIYFVKASCGQDIVQQRIIKQ